MSCVCADLHFPITNLFLPPNKQMRMCLQYTVSQHVGSAGGPSVFPEVKKDHGSLSFQHFESADVKQHADFFKSKGLLLSDHL